MRVRTRRAAWAAVALVSAVVVSSCDSAAGPIDDMSGGAGAGARPDRTTDALLRSVAATSARFNSIVQAEKAGYVADPVCVEVPGLGGMGHHYINENLVDATFDPLQPEALLYAPTGPHGKLKLVGVEYVVVDVGQAAPTFGDQPFDHNMAPLPFPNYTLHVWLWQDNPAGVFAMFNPTVSCGS